MSTHLVVVHAFASYKRGDLITDEATVQQVLKANARLVVKVNDHPAAPPPAAPAANTAVPLSPPPAQPAAA